MFKSNLFPLRLQLLTTTGEPYPVIFKNGDDLRQDQLVIQLFTLMDRLLRKENLDLKLMPYRVLATGPVDGMVQFVPSRTLQDITSEYGAQGLLGYLKANYPDPGSVGTYGVKPEVLETYIRSCGALFSSLVILPSPQLADDDFFSRLLHRHLPPRRRRSPSRQPPPLPRRPLLPRSVSSLSLPCSPS